MTAIKLRSFVSRVSASLRRSKPCGCAYPAGWSCDAVPNAHRVNDEVKNDCEYHVEYRCDECGGMFELHERGLLDRELNG